MIKYAAVKHPITGLIEESDFHHECWLALIDGNYDDAIDLFGEEAVTKAEGFTTSDGQFVDRYRAFLIAKESRQLSKIDYCDRWLDANDIRE